MRLKTLKDFGAFAADKNNFEQIGDYILFSLRMLEYLAIRDNQEIITAINEPNYKMIQFQKEGKFKITRPYNENVLYSFTDADDSYPTFQTYLKGLRDHRKEAIIADCSVINRTIYTLQQSLGFALDAGTALGVNSNIARKVAGDLFERLIILVLNEIGLKCKSGTVMVPLVVRGKTLGRMSFQQDLIIMSPEDHLKVIGSVKTTSKDRMAKVFIDKLLYCKLTDTQIPHIAVFLHDVQSANGKNLDKPKISETFLSGHFKGYTIKLNPLDGVYYCDLRPKMKTDPMLKKRIQSLDMLFCKDIWNLLDAEQGPI
jgi:hypothetical protein